MSKRNRGHLHKFYDADAEGPIEAAAARRRRLDDIADGGPAGAEVERSDSITHLERAAKRLKMLPCADRVLRVPQWNMKLAAEAMRKAGVAGTVSNLSGTRKRKVAVKRT